MEQIRDIWPVVQRRVKRDRFVEIAAEKLLGLVLGLVILGGEFGGRE